MTRLPAIRLVCALVCAAGFWTLVVGLVVDEGWLRVPGLGVFVIFLALSLGFDELISRQPDPLVEGYADPFAEIDHLDWDFPPRIDDRRAA